jgi:hypothetical protein
MLYGKNFVDTGCDSQVAFGENDQAPGTFVARRLAVEESRQ